jgi:hypothetical protein
MHRLGDQDGPFPREMGLKSRVTYGTMTGVPITVTTVTIVWTFFTAYGGGPQDSR